MTRGFRILLAAFVTLVLAFALKNTVLALNPNIQIYSDQYRDFLDRYRLQNDSTVIALQQYANLKTLASQEEAVQSMRNFLLIRADVITTHYSLLSAVLQDRQGIDPSWQASASAMIDTEKQKIASHRARSDIAVDRIKADQEAAWFLAERDTMLVVADRAQCLIGIGRDEEAIAALEAVKQRLDTWIGSATMSETQRVEKRRGSDELGRTIVAAKEYLQTAKAYYAQTLKNSSTAQVYGNIRPDLLSSYTQVVRGVQFAKELAQ